MQEATVKLNFRHKKPAETGILKLIYFLKMEI